MSLKVRHIVLPSDKIINLCGPVYDPFGWTEELIKERERRTRVRLQRSKTKQFFRNLEKSILANGFRNPIVVSTGLFSEEFKKFEPQINYNQYRRRIPPKTNLDEVIACYEYGGSRLWVAQKHKLDIPCVVNDFANMFPDEPTINTSEELLKYFTDRPGKMIWKDYKVTISQLPHVHMDKDHFS